MSEPSQRAVDLADKILHLLPPGFYRKAYLRDAAQLIDPYLPEHPRTDDILQPWVRAIGLRHQGVLVSAMRGCDTAPRHDPSKLIQRLLRGSVLEPHCGRTGKPMTYIVVEEDAWKWWDIVNPFLRSWDHYPNHYVMHFIQATEIIGYFAPETSPAFGLRWREFYVKACNALHLTPETREQCNERLNADEQTFFAAQENR